MDPRLEITIKLFTLLGMLVGLFGLVVPVFPGLTVIWALTLIHGLVFKFGTLGWVMFVVITLLMLVGNTVDNLLMGGKARQGGARWASIAIAFVAGFIGSIVLTPIGGIPVTLAALYFSEFAYRKNRQEAWEITKGMAIGWGWAFVARFGIGLVMIALWAIWAFA
jgi:hypothetical protein